MVSEDCLEVCFVGPVVRGNYVWYIVIVVVFLGFGQAGAKWCEGGFKVINWGGNANDKRVTPFIGKGGGGGGGFSLCHTTVLGTLL